HLSLLLFRIDMLIEVFRLRIGGGFGIFRRIVHFAGDAFIQFSLLLFRQDSTIRQILFEEEERIVLPGFLHFLPAAVAAVIVIAGMGNQPVGDCFDQRR